MRILLLEDDITLRESLRDYLTLEGFDVDIASSAIEAYDMSYENSYDLYLFDINLPDESGFSVLKNLKESGDNTPTFFITALVDIDSITKGFNVGADDFIYKDLVYNPATKELKKGEELINLGEVQLNIFDLLEFLEISNSNALRVNIARLKSMLSLDIKNIRGQGYILEEI